MKTCVNSRILMIANTFKLHNDHQNKVYDINNHRYFYLSDSQIMQNGEQCEILKRFIGFHIV